MAETEIQPWRVQGDALVFDLSNGYAGYHVVFDYANRLKESPWFLAVQKCPLIHFAPRENEAQHCTTVCHLLNPKTRHV